LKAWIVSNDISPDVPRGVIAAFTNKAAACREARRRMHENGAGCSVLYDNDAVVAYLDGPGEFGMRVQRFEVLRGPRSGPELGGEN
jgi:hypothetical protein